MEREPPNVRIVSGHAGGADIVSEFTALSQGREVLSIPAKWRDAGGKRVLSAGYKRNPLLVARCDRAVGSLWPDCRGSLHTELLLKKSKKPYEMIAPDLRNPGTVLFTSVHRNSRQAPPYSGPGGTDVSSNATSIWQQFAPSAPLLAMIQNARSQAKTLPDEAMARHVMDAAWTEYAPRYLDEMRTLYRTHPDTFVKTLQVTNYAVLLCYCPPHHPVLPFGSAFDPVGVQCHRRLLAALLVAVGARFGIRVIDGGEVDMRRVLASIQDDGVSSFS